MLGQNAWPEDFDPSVDALDETKVTDLIRQVHQSIDQTVRSLPSHIKFIQRSGGAAEMSG
jgi:tryptophan halogenase